MTIVYRQATYKTPGIYQWVKPPTGVGAGPFGSTYLQSVFTVIGGGSGGSSGDTHSGDAAGGSGGSGGNAGCYAQATYLPAALNFIEDITVGKGTPGGIALSSPSNVVISHANTPSVPAGLSLVRSAAGLLINSPGGDASTTQSFTSPTVNGGLNISSFSGCPNFGSPTINNAAFPSASPSTSSNISPSSGYKSYQVPPGNNAGAPGGCSNTTAFASARGIGKGTNGGGINGSGGGFGTDNTVGVAGSGIIPGAGGGAACSALPLAPVTGGNGANAKPSTGSGGGGGGSGAMFNATVPGGLITGGNGGNGSDGVVQVTDIFTMPVPPPVAYYNWDLVTWFHMVNMARPISLTGRYKS